MFKFTKKNNIQEEQEKKSMLKKILPVLIPAFAIVLGGATGCFAEEVQLTAPVIDNSVFEFILKTVTGYIAQIMPFGLKVIGLMVAVGFVPRLIYKFV